MPTTAPVLPAEADQMKKDMDKRFHISNAGPRVPSSHRTN